MSSEMLRKYIDILNEQKTIKEDLFTAGILGIIGYALLKFVDAWEENIDPNSMSGQLQNEVEIDDFFVFRNGKYMTGFRIGVSAERAAEMIKKDIASNPEIDYNTTYTIKHQGKVVFRFNLADADKNLNDFTRNFIVKPDQLQKAPQTTEPKQTLPQIKKAETNGNVDISNTNDPRAKYRASKTNKYFKP